MRSRADFKSLKMSKLWFTMSMLVILSLMMPCAVFAKGKTTRVSVSSSGTQGNGTDYEASISSDGRYVAFESNSNNLVADDTNDTWDIFVHDRRGGQAERVSVSSAGEQGNGGSWYLSISADGRYVAFRSLADNLVTGDTNDAGDIFVHDRQSGDTTRVSVSSTGVQGNNDSYLSSISSDNRYVAFESYASTLVSGDDNDKWDIFVHDLDSSETERVSVSSAGGQGDGDSRYPFISSDGRYVAFYSEAANLVSGDSIGSYDVFLHDRQTGQTTRLTDSPPGVVEWYHSRVSISSDNRYVVFESDAENLVPGDNNGSRDIFMYDRQTGKTTRVSVSTAGVQANGFSHDPTISLNGRHIAYESDASNLVTGDSNLRTDIFVYDLLTGNIVAQISMLLLD